ncbi:threonine aldolase family protein [Ensifer soli]|uniref:threonine aldolase family protein n=1 Tax=Ciceribacter sp. sgz301302 TaxID=3342379 RepID=UPI0035B7E727
MIFSSDNWAGADPVIAERLAAAASGYQPAYGTGPLDRKVEATFSEIFEREVAIFFVGTGTAANSLALASVNRPGGQVFCHREAHVAVDECGAPEFFSTGSRLVGIDGAFGRMDPAALDAAARRAAAGSVHNGQAMAITLTQATEAGTTYTLDDIATIGAIARDHGLPLHMDGARFANALVHLGTTPAEMTWKRGVDLLSFGATKNGCWCAEALVVFDPAKAAPLHYLRKRSAQLFSKSRFIAAQFDAYFEDGRWLRLAAHANAMAARLADGIAAADAARLAWPTGSNEVFAILSQAAAEGLRARGAVFYDWPAPHGVVIGADEVMIRLVTSFAMQPADVDAFIAGL